MEATIEKLERKLDKKITTFLKKNKIEVSKKMIFEEFLEDKVLIIKVIRKGIPYSLYGLIQDYTPFTDEDWANVLGISTKTLQRYKAAKEHRFKSIHSEKIIEMAEVTQLGLDVFGHTEKFKLWLNTPNFALGKLTPKELLKDSYGKEMVIAELTRINHGILV